MEGYNNIELTEDEQFTALNTLRQAKKYDLYKEWYRTSILEGLSHEESERKAVSFSQSETIVLTEDEENEAFNKAKEVKFYNQKTSNYYESLKAPKQFVLPSTNEFAQIIREKAKAEIEGFKESKEFDMLCKYFTNNEKSELSPKKGIILAGGIGTGKTSLMNLFKSNPKAPYVTVSCRSIANSYKNGGVDAIAKYYTKAKNILPQNHYGFNQFGWCFDDLGAESTKKHFGDELNVMAEIILNWYDKKDYSSIHMTTNLSVQEIENLYGERVKSRMREMFNFVTIENKEDLRK